MQECIMDRNNQENTGKLSGKLFFIPGIPAGWILSYLGLIFFYLYFVITPLFFSHAIEFPNKDEIHYSEGVFTYREVGRKNYQMGVSSSTNTEFFSCKSSYLSPDVCEVDRIYINQLFDLLKKNNKPENVIPLQKLYQKWKGKPVIIGWFRQRYNIFSTGRIVVQVIISDEEVVSNKNVIDTIAWEKNNWFITLVISSPLFIIIAIITNRIILNRDIKNGK